MRAHRQLVFRYHVLGCRKLGSQELLDQGYVTALSGHTLRISEREVSSYTQRLVLLAIGSSCRVRIQPPDSVSVPCVPSFNIQPRSEIGGRGVQPRGYPHSGPHSLALACPNLGLRRYEHQVPTMPSPV